MIQIVQHLSCFLIACCRKGCGYLPPDRGIPFYRLGCRKIKIKGLRLCEDVVKRNDLLLLVVVGRNHSGCRIFPGFNFLLHALHGCQFCLINRKLRLQQACVILASCLDHALVHKLKIKQPDQRRGQDEENDFLGFFQISHSSFPSTFVCARSDAAPCATFSIACESGFTVFSSAVSAEDSAPSGDLK